MSALIFLFSSFAAAADDWLVPALPPAPASFLPWSSGALAGYTLSNGLVSRTFVTSASGAPTFSTFDLTSSLDGGPTSILRALAPEARLACAGGCASRPMPLPPGSFSRVAVDHAATGGDCPFVAQGNTTSLAACQADCWSAKCNAVNWAIADCVLRQCANPLAPGVTPYPGFEVWTTTAPLPQGATTVGGLVAAPALGRSVSSGAYLNRTGLDAPGMLIPDPTSAALPFLNLTTGPLLAGWSWTPGARFSDPSLPWPPRGVRVEALFGGAGAAAPWVGAMVRVTYEAYEGIPLLSKRVEVLCTGSCGVVLDGVTVEELAVNYGWAPLASMPYAGQAADVPGGSPSYPGTGRVTPILDLQYGTNAAWTNDCLTSGCDAGSTQPRLTAGDDAGLAFPVCGSDGAWTSTRLWLLFHDDGPEQGAPMPLYPSSETYWGCTLGPCTAGSGTAFEGAFTERRGLALRRFLLTVAPQVAEAPLQYHLVASDSASVRAACDQMAAVGWEMLVLSYGSGFNLESQDAAYVARVKTDVDYCRAKGVEVGGYDLIGWTRDPGRGWAALNSDGQDTGNACFSSGWFDFFTAAALTFANATGVSVYETDGPYAGYACSNTSHSHGVSNSVQLQARNMAKTYTAMRNANIHINAPDSWMAHGINKMGIGYNEGISRLPRTESVVLYRQVAFDATTYTVPSATWSFLPLTGSDESKYEPVSQHLAEFEMALSGHLAYGVSAFLYQGDAMFDTPEAQALYVKWGGWFKAYRTLLSTGDLVHVKRPDGQGLDAILHAKAGAPTPALLCVWNPTDGPLTAELVVPLYYAGLRGPPAVNATWEPWPGGPPITPQTMPLDWRGRATITITVAARSITWATFEAA